MEHTYLPNPGRLPSLYGAYPWGIGYTALTRLNDKFQIVSEFETNLPVKSPDWTVYLAQGPDLLQGLCQHRWCPAAICPLGSPIYGT